MKMAGTRLAAVSLNSGRASTTTVHGRPAIITAPGCGRSRAAARATISAAPSRTTGSRRQVSPSYTRTTNWRRSSAVSTAWRGRRHGSGCTRTRADAASLLTVAGTSAASYTARRRGSPPAPRVVRALLHEHDTPEAVGSPVSSARCMASRRVAVR
jgi:hypothetical protein